MMSQLYGVSRSITSVSVLESSSSSMSGKSVETTCVTELSEFPGLPQSSLVCIVSVKQNAGTKYEQLGVFPVRTTDRSEYSSTCNDLSMTSQLWLPFRFVHSEIKLKKGKQLICSVSSVVLVAK